LSFDETELPEFVLKNLKRQRVVPIADHLLKRFLRHLGNYSVWLAALTVDCEQENTPSIWFALPLATASGSSFIPNE